MAMKEFLRAARSVARQAGIKAVKRVFGDQVEGEKPYGNIVTSADRGIEMFVAKSLRMRFPNHGFDGEEMGRTAGRSGYVWVVDPIDGTRYYIRHLPFYATSVALERRGKQVLGVVFAPELDHMYCAVAGASAKLNRKRISCSGADDLAEISVCLEIPSRDSPPEELRWAMEKAAVLIGSTRRVRVLGVGSLGLCFCATGGFDAYVNLGSALKRHDIAAGRVILEEAGGKYMSFGEKGNRVIAGPEVLCMRIRRLLEL